ncbi:MAG: M3 family metallopeptidase [Syntrophomonas sp.]
MAILHRKGVRSSFLFAIIVVLALLMGQNFAWAADTASIEVQPIQVFINGENSTDKLSTEGGQPYFYDGHTYLPVRAAAEQLGIPVRWVPESNSIYIGDLSHSPNPLLRNLGQAGQTPLFAEIKPEHFIPALEYAVAAERQDIEEIIQNPEAPSFANTIEPLERMNLSKEISNILDLLNAAENNDALNKVANDAVVILSDHENNIFFNKALFDRVAQVHRQAGSQNLTSEQLNLLGKYYQNFIDNGVNLTEEQQKEMRQIDSRLATLSNQFPVNLLNDTNASYMLITDPQELSGLPDNLVEQAAQEAQKREMHGWCFTMDDPTVFTFLSLADNRDKRKEMLEKSKSIGRLTPETDNQEIVKEIVNLRLQRSKLLGFSNYADSILKDRMAGNTETVMSFLQELTDASLPVARQEIKELEEYAHSKGLQEALENYDRAYYNNQLLEEKYSFNEEALRPYFELNAVKAGVFELTKRLYGLRFVPNRQIQVYHPDVEVYEVFDENDRLLGIFYMDFFCRDGKSAGAWTTIVRMQEKRNGEDVRPLVNIVYNFSPQSEQEPALLSFYDVTVFLHEFGHGLHLLLSDVNYASLSTFGVAWDFVEMPSSIMENWAYEPEFLRLFARDYKTGQLLPDKTIERLNQMRTVLNAYQFTGTLQYSLLDMGWHTITEPLNTCVEDFENGILKDIRLFPPTPGSSISTQFSHLFSDDYAAGYYSYVWSNVLDAEAFQVFKKNGIMNRKVGEAFRKKVLSKEATVDPMILFKDFVGRDPSTDALLKREGLR